MIDERTRAALGRLTENERACLQRRLQHQTAKEMAIDLGISPHAVEKRLKMARTKLGVSSSLEAARLLEANKGYGQTGPQASDLANVAPRRQKRLTKPLVIGGITMSMIVAGLIALAAQAPISEGIPPPNAGGATPVPRDEQGRPTMANGRPVTYETYDPSTMVRPSPAEIADIVTNSFAVMDQNHSGFIEPEETAVRGDADVVQKIYTHDAHGKIADTGKTVTITAAQARAQYIRTADKNGDGKIDFAEYRGWMVPVIAKQGIPAAWRKDIESHYTSSGNAFSPGDAAPISSVGAAHRVQPSYLVQLAFKQGERLIGSPKLLVTAGQSARAFAEGAKGARYDVRLSVSEQEGSTYLVKMDLDSSSANGRGVHVTPAVLVKAGESSTLTVGPRDAPLSITLVVALAGKSRTLSAD